MESITSQQELKTLLDEGKITQEEYQELLAAMKDKPRKNGACLTPDNNTQSITNLGKAALILFVVWVVLQLVGLLTGLSGVFLFAPVALIGLLAFIFGIIAWKTTEGKIAALGVPCFFICIILLAMIGGLFLSYRASEVKSAAEVQPSVIYKNYTCDSLDSLIVGSVGSPVENGVFSQDEGVIKIQVLKADTFHLYETGPLENADTTMLFYRARVKTEALNGRAYLELWCSIPGKGEFFSRGLDQTISGTNNWTTMQIPFRNDSGINPDNIKLNLVVESPGTGTIWIDDIQVTGNPI